MVTEPDPQHLPENLRYITEPTPRISATFSEGIFDQPIHRHIEFPGDVPEDIADLAPAILQLEEVGRMGVYPDDFSTHEDGTPIDNTFLHTLRVCTVATILANRISDRIDRITTPQLRDLLLIRGGMKRDSLLSTLWLHDLGENPDAESSGVDLVGFLNMWYDLREGDAEQHVPARVWDRVLVLIGLWPKTHLTPSITSSGQYHE